MQYLGISLWIAFIGIAVWGNWFFVVIFGSIAIGGTIGAIIAIYKGKIEYREHIRSTHQLALEGNKFCRDLVIKAAYKNPDHMIFVEQNKGLDWISPHYDEIVADAERKKRKDEEFRKMYNPF